MPNNNENLQFLICSQCNGLGFIAEKKCSVCDGHGVISYLDGNILHWSRKINFSFIRMHKLEKLVNNISFVFLVVLAISGFASLVYSVYFSDYNNILTFEYWLDKTNKFHLYFWLTIVFDMYLVYFLSLEKDKKEIVIIKKYQEDTAMDVIAPPPIDWKQVKQFDKKKNLDITKTFTAEAVRVAEKAFEVSVQYKALETGPVHYLIAALLLSQQTENIFLRLNIDLKDFAGKIGRLASRYPQTEGATVFSSESQKILFKAYRLAYVHKLEQVGVEEILQEAIKIDQNIQEILFDIDVSLEKIENVIMWYRIKKLLRQQWQSYRSSSGLKSKTGIDRAMTAIQTQYLNQFSEDLTMLAKMGYLNLCINREKEFTEMFRIMEGSSIKAIVLVGETGVGKSAIIDGLAQKMIADDVPEFLKDKRLVSISVSRLVSGVSASEAQERLLISINEVIAAGNVVLYIDNLHDIMGISAGGSDGFNLADVLVEALQKNLFTLISSTNPMNYTRYIENSSIGSIIKKVDVPEPEKNAAIQIIEGKIGAIEGKNNVYFSYNAIEKAVDLTDRFISDKFLPYKALTVLEEIAVWARKNKGAQSIVSGNDMATLISEKIGMQVSDITESESEKLINLEEIIHERMINQEEAVEAVANSLRRARAELRDQDRPIANLLFLGPTGVGKTELAKIIAAVYFNNEENMIRLDMSEYQEKTSINRLIGAPPGYGGGETGGQLTEAVRKKPFSIVLLDELEKAHPDILTVFLQVMEDGRLTDTSGRTIDFTNVILIATSNAGSQFIQEQVKLNTPIEEIRQTLLETELKQSFRPEFLNRFDNIIVFKPLSFENVVEIARLMLKDVAKNLEAKGMNFQATEEAITELAQIGFDPQFGARPLRRAIQDNVDNALAQFLLTGKISRRDIAILDKGGVIRVEKAKQL